MNKLSVLHHMLKPSKVNIDNQCLPDSPEIRLAAHVYVVQQVQPMVEGGRKGKKRKTRLRL